MEDVIIKVPLTQGTMMICAKFYLHLYSGTPLRRTPLGPKLSSFIARRPLLRDYVLNVQELIHCALSSI